MFILNLLFNTAKYKIYCVYIYCEEWYINDEIKKYKSPRDILPWAWMKGEIEGVREEVSYRVTPAIETHSFAVPKDWTVVGLSFTALLPKSLTRIFWHMQVILTWYWWKCKSKCNLPMATVGRLVGRLVGRSVSQNIPKGREVKLPGSIGALVSSSSPYFNQNNSGQI